ncbi:ATP-binding protein [Oculatella sp. LEGE 06141]|uniref:ATP-binding protein n=1 Tax=Oculatella sp. LEGE 06141 TaxID=1828648 RepID=UPI00188273A7|nr:ATP-binding protein [Oculatella sp. LEGE 06141]MBE9180871.1 ATP-binding protein [Oculatella sp. LEGE 06141]
MMDLTDWHQRNEDYLAAALQVLRSRLAERITILTSPSDQTAQEVTRSLNTSGENAELQQAINTIAVAETVDSPPALLRLSRHLRLSPFEQNVLLLCAAMELDTRIPTLCARAQDAANRPYPTFALALTLFDEAAWEVLSPERPLRYWRLVEIMQSTTQPLITSPLQADERIVNYIKGLNYLDDRLTPLLTPLDPVTLLDLPPSQLAFVDTTLKRLQQCSTGQYPPVIQLLGSDRLSKQLIATHIAASLGLMLYRLPVELLPPPIVELETLARLWQRESILLPIALYLDAYEMDANQTALLQRFLSRSNGLFFVDMHERSSRLGSMTLSLDITKPTINEQQAAWQQALGSAAQASPAVLADQFNLSLSDIQQIAQNSLNEAFHDNSLQQQLWDACLTTTRPQLSSLAQRLDPKATWSAIVLPADALNLLHQITDQVRQRSRVYQEWGFSQRMNRGMGISALFAGESGTGKTMAAEVIANDLHLDLYRIDLSAVVSKYIGETEKNLRRLFDAAEDGGTILFFDEADALFGKRSEVKDSHDRYANIEINYLLQRIEAYRGLAILATNMKSALDTAFLRRLRFIVNFPFPGFVERKAVWQTVFPPETPIAHLDVDRLARFNLTGGSIHNIALNAAFLAAQAGTPVTMPLVLQATRTELCKIERPINETEFFWQEPAKTTI